MVHNFVQGVRSSGGHVEVTFLRDFTILPCNACHFCFENADTTCALSGRDDAVHIFQQLEEAPLVFIAAPIFFYHLPAQFKAFIDRAQCYWAKREKERQAPHWKPLANPRPGIAGLVAARAQGDKLFEGSLLTLKYFLDLFGVRMQENCQLMGYDGPNDLASDDVACMRLYELGAKAQAMVEESGKRKDNK